MNFQVETTNYCDLTCSYCPNKDMQRKREFMSDEVWKKILHDFIVPYRHVNCHSPPTFIPHKDGEILLSKQLPSRLSDLAEAAPDMKVDIYSHGLMLPKLAKRGEDFIDFLAMLPNQVRLMMSYHPHNHDGSANDYAPVVTYLRDALVSRRPHNVEFITVSHKSKWVTAEMQEAWAEAWRGLPITVHANCSINPWTGRIEEATCRYNGCPYADFGHWFMGVTGNVIACCLDLEEEIVLGNVMTDSAAVLFERTERFYADQRHAWENKDRPTHAVCSDCFGHERPACGMIQLGVPA